MNDLAVIDSHVHLYDPAALSYPWMADIPQLNKPHSLADFAAVCGPVRVEGFIFVEVDTAPGDRLAEAEWVATLASRDDRPPGGGTLPVHGPDAPHRRRRLRADQ